jgi:serine/threonine protein kinase
MLEKGTQLAGYRIDGVLGQGGMGTVYEATQLSLDRVVALKVLPDHLSGDIVFRERFQREGQIQARLEHPHIVTVYEAGESEQGLFIAMRLIRGRNLKDMIVARELDAGRSLRILGPMAEALDDAHEIGLIHRDIKPQNILVGGRDHAYLADFGLTKGPSERSLTKSGMFVGTIDYIAPEQIEGKRATSATDVYALAAVLYECLTGVVPFPRESEAAVLYAHMAGDPPRLTDQRRVRPGHRDQASNPPLRRMLSRDLTAVRRSKQLLRSGSPKRVLNIPNSPARVPP